MANWQTNGNATGPADFLGTTNNQPVIIQTNNAERVRVASDGKVGVGLPNPAAELHVQGRIAAGLDNNVGGAISLLSPDGFPAFHLDNGPSGGRPAGRLRLSHGATPGANEVMSLVADGNVGVGLTAPAVKLHVAGNRIRLESGGRQLDLRADGAAVDVQSTTSDLYLHSLGPRNRNNVIINPFGQSGNVAVGLTDPQVKFHVVGNRIRLESGGRQLDLRSDGAHVDVQTTTSDLYLHSLGPRGRNNVIINPFGQSGNVGVGTTAPSDKLHVIGNVRANDFIVTSDQRLKRHIRPLLGSLAKVRRLRGVEFKWQSGRGRQADSGGHRLGVVAQEVERIAPELVHSTGDGYRGVNVTGLVATLIEAVKEIADENDRLARRVRALEGHAIAEGI
jgi:hypothetical protein